MLLCLLCPPLVLQYQVAITGAVLLAVLIVILVVLGQLGLLRSRKD